MRDLYFDERGSRALLIGIGYPPSQIPNFGAAATFWPEVILHLGNGIVPDGIPALLAAVVHNFPGSAPARDLLAQASRRSLRSNGRPPTVLALLADPERGSKLRIDREARLLHELGERDGIKITTRHAVRVTDIIRAILVEKPNILHFAGHGTQNGLLEFEGEAGDLTEVGPEALASGICAAAREKLDCVVLNSCYTAGNAAAFHEAANAVAGSTTAIDDDCALAFARGFYTGLGSGQSAEQAFNTARAQMEIERCDTNGLHFTTFPSELRVL